MKTFYIRIGTDGEIKYISNHKKFNDLIEVQCEEDLHEFHYKFRYNNGNLINEPLTPDTNGE